MGEHLQAFQHISKHLTIFGFTVDNKHASILQVLHFEIPICSLICSRSLSCSAARSCLTMRTKRLEELFCRRSQCVSQLYRPQH